MAPSEKNVFALILIAALTLHLTAASSFKQSSAQSRKNERPCWEDFIESSWPSEPVPEICGSDNVLYPSADAVSCYNSYSGGRVRLEPRGNCGDNARRFDFCKVDVFEFGNRERKVCGTDNATYSNIWTMACTAKTKGVQISEQQDGKCNIDCPYSPIYKPVCTTDGTPYVNEEALRCERNLNPSSTGQHLGKCTKDAQKYPCFYDDFSFGEVCASNGRTYTKAREVRCLKESNPALEVLHEGACTVQEVEKIIGLDDVCKMAIHTFESNPLCGSDNVTYSNAYTFLCAAKSSPKDKKLQVSYEGECFAIDKCPYPPSPTNFELVCGSDGVNYPSDQAFICAKLKEMTLEKLDQFYCHISTDFAPEIDPCLLVGGQEILKNPVCGSDKITYVSKSDLLCTAKTKPDIQIFHTGECV